MGQEYELKFSASIRQQEAVLAAYAGKPNHFTMETLYYDTPDRVLSRKYWTLRKRMENGSPVCTLKTPGQNGERGEWEVNAPTIQEGVEKLCKLDCPKELSLLDTASLQEICGARFTRIALTLSLPQGRLELACDLGVLLGGGREEPLCEIEVELKEGDFSLADSFGAELQSRFGLTRQTESKAARAYRLAQGDAYGRA